MMWSVNQLPYDYFVYDRDPALWVFDWLEENLENVKNRTYLSLEYL